MTHQIEQIAEEQHLRSLRNTLTFSQLSDGTIVPPPPLFEGLLLDETITMISGEPYTGKTLFLLAAAISLATGKALFGKYTPRELCRVLFIGQDAPTWDYAGQAMKLARGYGVTPEDFRHFEVDLLLNEGITITDRPFLDWLAQWHESTGFDVLMLDTLLDVHTADENSNSQMRIVMQQLKKIRTELGIAIIFTHHTAKPMLGDGRSANYLSRGATVIPGSSDFHFQLRQGREHIDLLWPKGRGASGMDPPTGFTINESSTEHGPAIVLEVPTDQGRRDTIASALTEGTTRSALIAAVVGEEPGLDPRRAAKFVDNTLQSMKKSGEAIQEARGRWKLQTSSS